MTFHRIFFSIFIFLSLSSTGLAFEPDINGPATNIALQIDGEILIAGGFDQVNQIHRKRIARLNPDGSLNTSSNLNNSANKNISALVIQDGSVDTLFDPGTGVNRHFNAKEAKKTLSLRHLPWRIA